MSEIEPKYKLCPEMRDYFKKKQREYRARRKLRGNCLSADLESQIKMYIDGSKDKPNKADLINKASILGLKILNVIQKPLSENNVDDAIMNAKVTIEEIVMELSK